MIGLSGLITPSLDEMTHVAAEMNRRGLESAAADRWRDHEQTPHRGENRAGLQHETIHVVDASRAVPVVGALSKPEPARSLSQEPKREQQNFATVRKPGRASTAELRRSQQTKLAHWMGRAQLPCRSLSAAGA
jgi:5-methyltetrahydrofolate--homocysteine methyltransferase